MPNKRLAMKSIREILRLHFDCGFSRKKIQRITKFSRTSICEYISRAQESGISWPLPEDDNALENLLFPGKKPKEATRPIPDCPYIHTELRKKHVTLALLWMEYKLIHPDGYQYTQFCDYYRAFEKKVNLSMRQIHKAGEKAFCDFAGDTTPVIDPKSGIELPAHLFVCTLGASNFTFARAYWDETSQSWCSGQASAFRYFGGVTELVIPDNPRSVVNKPSRYEPEIHPDFQYMAEYHGTAVIPARVARPKDKAKVEAGVLMSERWILAALRNRKFFSLEELNEAIDELLENLNDKPFKKLPGSRRTLFEQIDKPALKQLPDTQYKYTKILEPKVNIDYHIEVEDILYSVPHYLAHETVYVRLTLDTLEVFHKGKREASHIHYHIKRPPVTLDEHMPEGIRRFKEWSPSRIVSWAAKTGPATAKLVEAIMRQKRHPEQGYRSCLGIIRLGDRYGKERVELACELALEVGARSYSSVSKILSTDGDKRRSRERAVQLKVIQDHENLRGPDYYKDNNAKEDDDANTSDTRGA
ncbi:MAG: IS21 family transposase [Nitrososphaera sp.]|nr:IS21 family transposase [Nitrososphaera sp.]